MLGRAVVQQVRLRRKTVFCPVFIWYGVGSDFSVRNVPVIPVDVEVALSVIRQNQEIFAARLQRVVNWPSL